MKFGDTSIEGISDSTNVRGHNKYATELVRQLEVATVRNPQLAQYLKSVLFQIIHSSACSTCE
jgi:hypothetical protein